MDGRSQDFAPRQHDRAGGIASKQDDAECFLDKADVVAHGTLGEAQFVRRLGHTAKSRDRFYGTERGQGGQSSKARWRHEQS
ncbi:hypothetical protein GCM10023067_33320 [Aminobacter aganoensis]